jgi:hypothetical protein
MGWVGLAQNAKSGRANLFLGIKMLLRNFVSAENIAKYSSDEWTIERSTRPRV